MFYNCNSLKTINLKNFNLTRFKSDYYEFDFTDLFTGVNEKGVLTVTIDMIPSKIQDVFPEGWTIKTD